MCTRRVFGGMDIEPGPFGLESDALASRLPTASEVECVIIQLLFAGPFLNLSCVIRRSIFQRTIDKYSACVEVGTTHKHLRRGVNSNNFNYITCEEVKSVESKFSSLDTSYVRATGSQRKKAKVEDKQFKTLNKETATHIGIREAEDWFRPIDLAKE
ncbi:hypothetical protein TNCV_510421 [Trichonephila clavipes]|nr:hypothetical protein TNCV_510421 [Trichonephila clavipes]